MNDNNFTPLPIYDQQKQMSETLMQWIEEQDVPDIFISFCLLEHGAALARQCSPTPSDADKLIKLSIETSEAAQ
tara:strand:+ start:724 stop:945 length:222 start_codon:yes stop_codon:yes gene_type:complete